MHRLESAPHFEGSQRVVEGFGFIGRPAGLPEGELAPVNLECGGRAQRDTALAYPHELMSAFDFPTGKPKRRRHCALPAHSISRILRSLRFDPSDPLRTETVRAPTGQFPDAPITVLRESDDDTFPGRSVSSQNAKNAKNVKNAKNAKNF